MKQQKIIITIKYLEYLPRLPRAHLSVMADGFSIDRSDSETKVLHFIKPVLDGSFERPMSPGQVLSNRNTVS